MQHIASLYGTKPKQGASSFYPADEERMVLVFCIIYAIPAPSTCFGIKSPTRQLLSHSKTKSSSLPHLSPEDSQTIICFNNNLLKASFSCHYFTTVCPTLGFTLIFKAYFLENSKYNLLTPLQLLRMEVTHLATEQSPSPQISHQGVFS